MEKFKYRFVEIRPKLLTGKQEPQAINCVSLVHSLMLSSLMLCYYYGLRWTDSSCVHVDVSQGRQSLVKHKQQMFSLSPLQPSSVPKQWTIFPHLALCEVR